jgi:hypothetical protein
VLAAVKLEAKGIPAVAVVTKVFEDLAARMAEHNQRPELPVLVLPYPMEDLPTDEIRTIARAHYPELLRLMGVTGV